MHSSPLQRYSLLEHRIGPNKGFNIAPISLFVNMANENQCNLLSLRLRLSDPCLFLSFAVISEVEQNIELADLSVAPLIEAITKRSA